MIIRRFRKTPTAPGTAGEHESDQLENFFAPYDIRGIVDQDFDTEWVRVLGRACGAFFLRQGWDRAVVGHDCRASSAGYQRAMAEGLAETGLDVLCLGQVSSPVFYFAAKHLGFLAGVMITASHNPKEYNGSRSGAASPPSTTRACATSTTSWPRATSPRAGA